MQRNTCRTKYYKRKKMSIATNYLPCEQCDFGSLLDWVPIINEDNMFLIFTKTLRDLLLLNYIKEIG